MGTTSLIPSLAAALAEWFPEMKGRFIAVSEIEPFDNSTNVPTLPMGFVALVSEEGQQGTPNGAIQYEDDILVHFAFQPVRYTKDDGSDTPFFAFYDYEPIRDKLLALTQSWRSPRNIGLTYRSMDVEATEYAVYIAFRFRATGRWCVPDEFAAQPSEYDITVRVMPPRSTAPCVDPCPPPPDPCDPARERNPHGRESRDA